MLFFSFRSPRADSRPLGKAPFRPVVAAAMLLAALLAAAFLAPWWRSYLGLTLDGYFPLYGHLILEGKIPYRDFFLHLPPLHALFDAAIQSIFGKSLLTLRILGAAERLLMAAVLVFWLSRHPGLALLTVLAVAGTPRFRGAAWLKAPVLAVVVVTVLAAATQKMISPFDFAMWREPSPEDALYESAHPALAGILLGEKTRDAVDGTLSIIERASRPGEAIFAFSDMPIFYWLADRPFVSFAALSWFDVTPDRIVDADRQRLFEELPPVIVFHQIPNHFMVIHEDYFRDGNESALRRMQDQIHELGTNYQVAGFYEPWRQYPPLQVWVRRDRAAEIGLVE